MTDTVPAWVNAREQISWMWKILSENHVRDTEVWVEISPANRYLTAHLAQRVDAILLRSLDMFLSDPDIIERYNLAFSKGWKSPEWQDMPTLKDFPRFCSIARLNIQKPEAIDHQAINQITSQIAALLVSPLGSAIAKPSSFSPEPMVKFYALTGLSNDQDSYTMAVAAKAACLPNFGGFKSPASNKP